MMKKGDVNDYIEGGKISTILFETLGEIPSLFDLVWYLPTASIARHMEAFAQSLIDARRFGNAGRSDDIASWLLGEHDDKPTTFSSDTLRVESLFAIQAGAYIFDFSFLNKC
jgi:cytochrome P450